MCRGPGLLTDSRPESNRELNSDVERWEKIENQICTALQDRPVARCLLTNFLRKFALTCGNILTLKQYKKYAHWFAGDGLPLFVTLENYPAHWL